MVKDNRKTSFGNSRMTVEQVKLLIHEGEGLTLEFKERYTPRIDEDIVAFANARGGTLLLGVRDDGSITGESLTNDLKAKINSLAPQGRTDRHGHPKDEGGNDRSGSP